MPSNRQSAVTTLAVAAEKGAEKYAYLTGGQRMWIGSQAELTLRLPGLGTPQYRGLKGWARRGSNLRPLACEASALPLSYAPWQGVSLPPRFAAPRLEREVRHEPAAARAAHGHAAGAGRAHAPVREGEALQGRGRRGEPQRVAPRRGS